MIVEIVQADFAPGDDFRMLRELCQFIEMPREDLFRFVRMNPDRRVDPIMLLGKWQRGIELFGTWTWTCADGEQRRHARGARPIEHGLAVFRELRKINVRV